MTAGSDDALKIVCEALATKSGRIIFQQPNYEQHYARLRGLDITSVRFGADRPHAFSVRQFEEACWNAAPSCLLLTNPNSPTGFSFTLPEMERIATAADQFGHLLLIDEAYVPYNGFDHRPLLDRFESVVLIRSLSKSLGIAGLRIGLIAASPRIIEYLARWNPHAPMSGVAVRILPFLLDRAALLAEARLDIIACRTWWSKVVPEVLPRWVARPSAANFVNFHVGEDPGEADAVVAFLQSRRILIRNMSAVSELASCVRFTVADRATMEKVLVELTAFATSRRRARADG